MAVKDAKSDDRWGRGALFIPAGLFLGFGIGFLIDNIPGGMFLGFGIGFFAYAISLFFK
jgi:hypothetical protein